LTIERFGVVVLLSAVIAVLCGCSDCGEREQVTVSPDGGTTIHVVQDTGYGGATGGSYTSVYLVNNRAVPLLRRPHGIAGIDGYPDVKPTWNSNKSLTMEVAFDKGTGSFGWRKTEALGVTIRWAVTGRVYEPDPTRVAPQPKPSDTRTVHP
jgi:hypothetical protein